MHELSTRFPHAKFNTEGKALKGDELIEFLKGMDGAIVALEPIDEDVIKSLPSLKVVSKYGVGLNNIDLDCLKREQKTLGWTGGINARSVSELTLSFCLGISRNVFNSVSQMKNQTWTPSGGRQLTGKTIGIIGFGHIGRDLASLLQGFGVQILVNDIIDYSNEAAPYGRFASKDEIYRNSDIITLHVPFTKETEGMIDKAQFKLMKPDCLVINTSRGGIINETALIEALEQQEIGAAAMDVFVKEPFTDGRLLNLPNFFATPHIGGSAEEAMLSMGRSAIQNLHEGFDSHPGSH